MGLFTRNRQNKEDFFHPQRGAQTLEATTEAPGATAQAVANGQQQGNVATATTPAEAPGATVQNNGQQPLLTQAPGVNVAPNPTAVAGTQGPISAKVVGETGQLTGDLLTNGLPAATQMADVTAGVSTLPQGNVPEVKSPWESDDWVNTARQHNISWGDAYRLKNKWNAENGKEPVSPMDFLAVRDYDPSKPLKDAEKEKEKQERQEKWEKLGNLFSHIGNFVGTTMGAPDAHVETAPALKQRQMAVEQYAQQKRDKAVSSYIDAYYKDRADKLAQAKAQREEVYNTWRTKKAEIDAEKAQLALDYAKETDPLKKQQLEQKIAAAEQKAKEAAEEYRFKVGEHKFKEEMRPLQKQEKVASINAKNRSNQGGSGGSGGRSSQEGYVVYDDSGNRSEYKGKNGLHDAHAALPEGDKTKISPSASASEKTDQMKKDIAANRKKHERSGGKQSQKPSGSGRYGGTRAGGKGKSAKDSHKFTSIK